MSATTSASATTAVRWRDRLSWRDALALVALLIVAAAAVLPAVMRQPAFSQFDEATHLDYAYVAGHGHVPARGDEITEPILQLWSCYGTEVGALPGCGVDASAASYPGVGSQYNFKHPPVYYAITGVAARGIAAVTGLDFVTSARATGVLWMFAGMATLWAGMRLLGTGRWLAASLAAAGAVWWTSLTASIHVTNDAAGLLVAGLVVLLVAATVRQSRLWWLLPTLVAGFAASTKSVNAVAVLGFAGACLLLACVPRLRPAGARWWQLLVAGVGPVVAVLGTVVVWHRFQAGRGNPDWTSPITGQNGVPIDGDLVGSLLRTVLRGFQVVGHTHVDLVAAPLVIAALATVATAVVIATPFVGLATHGRDTGVLLLSVAVILGLLAWPTIAQLEMLRVTDFEEYFPEPSGRYGLSVPPVAAGLLGVLAARHGAARGVMVAALVFVAATLVAVWFPALG